MDLTIDTATNSNKGRSFTAKMVAHSRFKRMEPETNNHRPTWAMFAGTETQLRPFVANLMLGRSASETRKGGTTIEFLKSRGYKVIWQRLPSGMTATIYRQDVYMVDPGMADPVEISFSIIPTKEFLHPDAAVAQYLKDNIGEAVLKKLNQYQMVCDCDYIAALAPSFAAFIDRRCLFPIIPDHRFYARLLVTMLGNRNASFGTKDSHSSRGWGTDFGIDQGFDEIGVSPPLYVYSLQSILSEILAEQVKKFVSGDHAIDVGYFSGRY